MNAAVARRAPSAGSAAAARWRGLVTACRGMQGGTTTAPRVAARVPGVARQPAAPRTGRRSLAVLLALGGVCLGAAGAAGPGETALPVAAAATPAAPRGATGIERRVALLARELELDADQQGALRDILAQQRAQVARVWADASVPGAIRISRTQAISEHTAQRIRALLREEQRGKFSQPRQRETAVGAPGGRVQTWTRPGNPG